MKCMKMELQEECVMLYIDMLKQIIDIWKIIIKMYLAIYIQTEYFYKDIAGDVEKWFDTSNYDKNDERPLPIGKNKKVIGMFKDELVGKILTEFIALRAKIYSYLIDDYYDMMMIMIKIIL